jgi:hypothetical protein
MHLFSVVGDAVDSVSAVPFAVHHLEQQFQSWADSHPALINGGRPMISLGREIPTRHGHYVDNLFIDGAGTLVAAEIKRGKSPRDVVAQMLDYAAFVSGLSWSDIDRLCRNRHGSDASTVFDRTFGNSLNLESPPGHRLAIVAESFEPSLMETARYLINSHGVRLVLIEFKLFEIAGQSLLHIEPVLGELPEQVAGAIVGDAVPSGDSYANWLLPSIAEKLQGIGEAQGWPLRYRRGQQTVTFHSTEWPLHLGDCQFRVDLYRAGIVSTRFSFRSAKAHGLRELLEARRSEWEPSFPAKIDSPPYETKFVTLTLDRSRPEVGDHTKLDALVAGVAGMTAALRPLVDEHFAATAELKSEVATAGQGNAGVPQGEAATGIAVGIGLDNEGSLCAAAFDPTVPGAASTSPKCPPKYPATRAQ